MRNIVLVAVAAVVLAAAGCAAQGLPIEGSGTGGAGNGGSGGSGGTGGSGQLGPDMTSRPMGPVGAMCTSACDCKAGLACVMGACASSPLGQLYCCADSNCPMGQFCQSSDGSYGQCGVGTINPGGPPTFNDLGISFPRDAGAGMCAQIMCTADKDCMAAGCMTCSRRGTCR